LGRRQRSEHDGIYALTRAFHGRQPRNRLAAPGYVDRLPRLNLIDEFAKMGFGVN
jgi:hypothetical protein